MPWRRNPSLFFYLCGCFEPCFSFFTRRSVLSSRSGACAGAFAGCGVFENPGRRPGIDLYEWKRRGDLSMAVVIRRVRKSGVAFRRGVRPGEVLQAINGHEIMDVLDYRFYEANACLLYTSLPFFAQAKVCRRALSKSSIRSSAFSIPTERRTVLG